MPEGEYGEGGAEIGGDESAENSEMSPEIAGADTEDIELPSLPEVDIDSLRGNEAQESASSLEEARSILSEDERLVEQEDFGHWVERVGMAIFQEMPGVTAVERATPSEDRNPNIHTDCWIQMGNPKEGESHAFAIQFTANKAESYTAKKGGPQFVERDPEALKDPATFIHPSERCARLVISLPLSRENYSEMQSLYVEKAFTDQNLAKKDHAKIPGDIKETVHHQFASEISRVAPKELGLLIKYFDKESNAA